MRADDDDDAGAGADGGKGDEGDGAARAQMYQQVMDRREGFVAPEKPTHLFPNGVCLCIPALWSVFLFNLTKLLVLETDHTVVGW